MMALWIQILVIAACLAAAGILLRYYLSMFQQNSYRPERFLRWLKENPVPHPFRKEKLKFRMTLRMVRLTVVTALLMLGLCALLRPWGAVACVLLTPALMLLANLLLSPVEKAVGRWYYNDAAKRLASMPGLIIIGVTGSYGKTSTKNYLYRLLSEKYNVLMTPGNFNTTLGVVRTIREQLQPFHQVFIVEMGAKQKGDIAEICALVHPRIGIVTAVGDMHLETFGSRDVVRKTKFELLEALPSDGLAVINEESEGIMGCGDVPAKCEVVRYGIDAPNADVRAQGISYSRSGMEFDLSDIHLSTRLLGDCNVLNIAAAVIVARRLGVSAGQCALAVSKLQPVEHRLSISRKGSLTVLDDAYNSNPEGAAMALSVLGAMDLPAGAHRIVVTPGFVELGARQREECITLGWRAAAHCDLLVIVNKYNREAILEGARQGGMDENNIICADTLAQAVALMQPFATPGSVVLYENDLPDTFR